jgi:predicted Fe-Mo cluster-binding NifX family protein
MFKKSQHRKKIAVPSTGKTLDSLVNNNLGRSPFIIFYDGESRKYDCIKNIGSQVQDGSGLMAAELILKNGANILLTREIGLKAYSVLMREHIDVHLLSSTETIKAAINKFLTK